MFRRRQPVTVADAVETYLADLSVAGRAKTTVSLYRYLLTGLIKRVGPGRRLMSLHREDIVDFLGQVKGRGGAQSYVNLTGHCLKTFLTWAVRQDYLKANPMDGMILPKEHPQPRRPFTDDEIRRLMAAATTPLAHAVVLILLDTGVRASELTGLRLEDVDFQAGVLMVHGKGDKERVVALNPVPCEALRAYLASRAQEDGAIWPEHFNRKALAYLLDCLGRQAHLARIHPHLFRHTFATRFLAETGNPLALQALLGHSTLDMVRRYVATEQGNLALEVHHQHPLT
jgi:integrase/recombinase XerD